MAPGEGVTILDDIRFVIGSLCAPISDESWTNEVLQAFADFVETRIAPNRHIADAMGCTLRDGRVCVPEIYQAAFRDYVGLGWHTLGLPKSIGGAGAPIIVAMAAGEILAGGDHAFELLVGLVPGAVRAIGVSGTPDQIARFCGPLATGDALATMCLTEPQAGSDLGAIRTRGAPAGNGKWRINGEKIFISGGDQNLSGQIIHLVLARTGAADSRTKGLSLFVCASTRGDGRRNNIETLRIETKMGLHGAPTCHLRFDDAEAELLGIEGEGLKAMFVMMDNARLVVALQAVGTAATATRRAREYARTREQGGRNIAAHADVARMLIEMDVLTMSARALAYCACDSLDRNPDLAEFLTPIAKSFATEVASHVADLGIQVLGGYGYLPEYRMEQLWRDSRITRIYEGTNGIQAMTLVNRLLAGNDQAWVTAFAHDISERIATSNEPAAVAQAFVLWQAAKEAVQGARDPGFAASSFMEMTAMLHVAALWLTLEVRALNAGDPQRIDELARFWRAIFPARIAALGEIVTALCAFEPPATQSF